MSSAPVPSVVRPSCRRSHNRTVSFLPSDGTTPPPPHHLLGSIATSSFYFEENPRLMVVTARRQPRPLPSHTAPPPPQRSPNGPKGTRRMRPPLAGTETTPLVIPAIRRLVTLQIEPRRERLHNPRPRPPCTSERRSSVLRSHGPSRACRLALPLQLRLLLLPPRREAVKQPERGLSGAIEWHFVLELAALLRERTGALMHPLVAIHLVALRARRRRR